MSSTSKKTMETPTRTGSRRSRNCMIFAVIALMWLGFDIASKHYFTQAFAENSVTSESVLGIFQFTLVHNTGAAWGIFGDSTEALAITSLVVSALLLCYFLVISARANSVEVIGLSLIIAGGIGNAIDRFSLGYVVDFIEFSFIDFPVFNIADIGVTCGFVILLIGIVLSWRIEDKARKQDTDSVGEGAEQ